MPAIWNGTLSTVRCEVDGLGWPVALTVHPRARRLKLRLDTERRELRLTVPPGASRRAALRWAHGQREWVAGQLAALPDAEPFAPGMTIPFDGRDLVVTWCAQGKRKPEAGSAKLYCGGPREGLGRRVERFLRAEALRILSAETTAAAIMAGVTVRSVSVGDARTRWGSCSSDGRIRYNWRLVMAPPNVRRWVVAHEVAHRRHMDHGPAFRALEAKVFGGDCAAARSILGRIGPRLKRIGRLG
jgi:predicted metal-dependent hydrolase